jgi:hypothetical protein
MITVGYGMHRKKEEILVGEMMKSLSEKPYKNLNFVDLNGRSWRYLAAHSEGFVFDVHGGSQEQKIITSVLRLPVTSFLLFSSAVEDEFLSLLRKYNTGEIHLVHKNKKGPLRGSNDYWQELPQYVPEYFKGAMDGLRRCGLIDRFVGIECFNAMEEWQVKQHREFMKIFLSDLDVFADSKR